MLMEAILVIEGHKMMLKAEIPITSRVILVKYSNKDGSAPQIS